MQRYKASFRELSDKLELQQPRCELVQLNHHLTPLLRVICEVFTKTSRNLWRCEICPKAGVKEFTLSKAIRHEETAEHTYQIRARNNPHSPSTPLRFYTSRHQAATVETDDEDDGPSSPTPQARGTAGKAAQSGLPHRRRSAKDSSALFASATEAYPEPDAAQLSEFFYSEVSGLNTLHGPAVEGDDEDQIYDNWGGELRYSMPTNPDLDEFGEELPDNPEDIPAYDELLGEDNETEDLASAAAVPTPPLVPSADMPDISGLFATQGSSVQSLREAIGMIFSHNIPFSSC